MWITWLILVVVLYLAALAVIRPVKWVFRWMKGLFVEAGARRPHKTSPERRRPRSGTRSRESADSRAADGDGRSASPRPVAVPAAARRAHPLAALAGWARGLVAGKNYEYWVGIALREDDPLKKVKYCTKALELNPTYTPVLGLKASTLLETQRYAEALACFDQLLELHPTALSWYEKGLCCYHLKRLDDAIQAFRQALAGCDQDRQLSAEILKRKKIAEEELRLPGAESRK